MEAFIHQIFKFWCNGVREDAPTIPVFLALIDTMPGPSETKPDHNTGCHIVIVP